MGGYQPVTDQDEQSSIRKNLAPLAFQAFATTHNLTGCAAANTVIPANFNVTKACKQVCSPEHTASFCLTCHLAYKRGVLRRQHYQLPIGRTSTDEGCIIQVVAGTNYAFAFRSSYDCTTPSSGAATGSVLLNSIVYEPLPSSGQNTKPQVSPGRTAKGSRSATRCRVFRHSGN